MTANYALIGVAGYIAPRHLLAIKETSGNLLASYDISDNVGIIDSYFPDSQFFKKFDQFYNYIIKDDLCKKIDFFSICSPNYLHKAHIISALRFGANAICEKPLVLSPIELNELSILEKQTGKKINTILQLRLHKSIAEIKKQISSAPKNKMFDVELSYFTSRGNWYQKSWKGLNKKSGGLLKNIGIHFFDLLLFLFGPVKTNIIHLRKNDVAAGYLEFSNAKVKWMLSINRLFMPDNIPSNMRTYRSIKIDGKEIEFSEGFNDLHTLSYQKILTGSGFGINDARAAIQLTTDAQDAIILPNSGEPHPNLKKVEFV